MGTKGEVANAVVEPRFYKGKVLVKGLALGLRARWQTTSSSQAQRRGGASESERAKRRPSARRERVPFAFCKVKSMNQRFGFGTKGKVGNDVGKPSFCKGKV